MSLSNSLRLFVFVILALCTFVGNGVAQNVPADLQIVASAGGREPWSEVRTLRVSANGSATYSRFESAAFDADAVETKNFNLTPQQMAAIWQAIQDNDFFSLPMLQSHPAINGRTFASLSVRANGTTNIARTRNVAVAAFDNIMTAINDATPEDDLLYDTSESPVLEVKDPCALQTGIDAFAGYEVKLSENKLFSESDSDFNSTNSAGDGPVASHPGTMLGCEMSLNDAVDEGIAHLFSKGEYYGDAVAIRIDNSNNRSCNDLTLRMFLEFWGEDATTVQALKIQNSIQSYWNGYTTSDGKTLTVLVDVRVDPGSDVPPGTPGYHQIQLVDEKIRSHVYEIKEVNQGTGGGLWEVDMPDRVFAHEAGHLMGLHDRYYEYDKQPDGSWVREDGVRYTAEEFANLVQSKDPQPPRTLEEINQKLDSIDHGSLPWDGHETDLMGDTRHLDDRPVQGDIDDIAADPGLIVDVPAGSMLVNRSNHDQSLVVTKSDRVYAGPGETRQLNGIYAACMDYSASIPNAGQIFDVAPHLSQWNGVNGTQQILQILDYVNANDFHCEQFVIAQGAIWRITDNLDFASSFINMFMESAGVNVGDAFFDFPHIESPNQSTDDSGTLVPKELYVSRVSPHAILTTPGSGVNLGTEFLTPQAAGVENITTTGSWTFTKPAASSATLSSTQGNATAFFADVRGSYKASHTLQVSNAPGQAGSFNIKSNGGAVVAADDLTETFENGGLVSGPFVWKTFGDKQWVISAVEPHSGAFAAASPDLDLNQRSALAIDVILPQADKISFSYRVSFGLGDSLNFYVDGVLVGYFAGDKDWLNASFDLSAGQHTLVWEYARHDFFQIGHVKAWIDDVFFPTNANVVTAVEESDPQTLPTAFQLSQNYPNPFNPTTTISYSVPMAERVQLRVYDIMGREVALLVDEVKNPGTYRVAFDGKDLSSGIYFYQMQAGAFSQVRRLALVK
jgi:hypothetical protein